MLYNITNNTFIDPSLSSIVVVSAGQVSVTHNTIINAFCDGSVGYTQYAFVTPYTPFSFVAVTGLTLQGNNIVQNASCTDSQLNYGAPVQLTGCSGVSAQTFAPVTTLGVGQTISSPGKLFSANGNFFLTVQTDGNLVVYNTTTYIANGFSGGDIFSTASYGVSSSPPMTLSVTQVTPTTRGGSRVPVGSCCC